MTGIIIAAAVVACLAAIAWGWRIHRKIAELASKHICCGTCDHFKRNCGCHDLGICRINLHGKKTTQYCRDWAPAKRKTAS